MTRYAVPSAVLMAELEGQEVLLNPDTGVYHLVNETGRAVLERIRSGLTREEAAAQLAEETGEPVEKVANDVLSFVEALVARGLLIEVDA